MASAQKSRSARTESHWTTKNESLRRSLTQALDLLVWLLCVLGILDLLDLHPLVQESPRIMQPYIWIALIRRIALRFFQRHNLESLLLQQIQCIRQNRAAERTQMQQQHVVDLVTENQPRLLPAQVKKFRSRIQVARSQPRNRFRIVLRRAPRIRRIPQVVLPVERHLRDSVPVRLQESPYCTP